MKTKHLNIHTHPHTHTPTHTPLTLTNSEDTCTGIQVSSQQGPARKVRQLLRVGKPVPWAEGSTKEENWGNAMQSRQDPRQFSDLSEGRWGPLLLLENCASLAAGKRPASHLEQAEAVLTGALENTLEALCLNLLFPFYSISDLSSPPAPFSLGLPFSQAGCSPGWTEHRLPGRRPFNTAGICRIGRPEGPTLTQGARAQDGASPPTFAFDAENP